MLDVHHRPTPVASLGGHTGEDSLRALLHPSERSRFTLAVAASGIAAVALTAAVVILSGVASLVYLVATVVAVGLTVWLSTQVLRAHLLGHAARVSVDNLPEVQAVLDDVRIQLDYDRPVDVYVMDQVESHALLVKLLSTRMILLGGDFVADTLSAERRAELSFLIARFIGALKAKHLRLQPVRLAIVALEKLGFLNLFLYPYNRATVYSGDQIGLVCCGDLRAALRVLGGLMVGTKLAPELGLGGILDQAVGVRRYWLPRLRQLFLSHPHLTSRYLNLLAFAEKVDPAMYHALAAELDERAQRRLSSALGRDHGARPRRGRRALGLAATLTILVALGTGLTLRMVAAAPNDPSAPDPTIAPPEATTTTTGQQSPPPPPMELARSATASASATAPSSVDAGGNSVDYDPGNVIDGRRMTAWRTSGDGRGETLTLQWDRPVRVASVGLIPGYDKHDPYDGSDRFAQNRRIRTARIILADGSSWNAVFTPSRQLQRFRIEGVTDSVTIEVLATVPGLAGFDDTAISEVSVLGYR